MLVACSVSILGFIVAKYSASPHINILYDNRRIHSAFPGM